MYNIIYNKNISKIKKQKYEKVIEFVINDLKLKQDMEINFVGSDCLYGYDGSMHKAKNNIKIEIKNKRCEFTVTGTIAHELRHAYQFENNIDYSEYDAEEYAYQTNKKIWKNETFLL